MIRKKKEDKLKENKNKDDVTKIKEESQSIKEEIVNEVSYDEFNKYFKDILPIIETRRSIRKYKDIPVEWRDIMKILEAGRHAPTTGNLQSMRFIVITNNETIEKISESCIQQYWIATAPVLIVVCNEDEIVESFYGKVNKKKYSIQNASASIQNMLLETHSLGLSSCWVGGFEEEKIRRELKIPSNVSIHAILPIGYSDEEPEMPKKYPLYNFVYLGEYGVKVKNKYLLTGDYSEFLHSKIKEIIYNLKKKKRRISKKIKSKIKK